MKQVLSAVAASFVCFTRIPIPWQLPKEAFPSASWHLPLLGWFFLACLCLVQKALGHFLPNDALLLLYLLLPLLLSGAMHEDGLADTADGLFGGTTVERRLEIMKDPRVGSFGVLALVFLVLGQYLALKAAPVDKQLMILALSLPLSRALGVLLLKVLPYVRSPESRAAAYIKPDSWGFLWTILWVLPVFFLFPEAWAWIIACGLALFLGFVGLFYAKLGGVTGDSLGAAVKLSELAFLWLLAILLQ